MPSKRVLYVGDELEVETRSGSFRGRIHHLDKETLLLGNVISLDKGITFPGIRCFNKNEVISSKFLKSGRDTEATTSQSSRTDELRKTIEVFKASGERMFYKNTTGDNCDASTDSSEVRKQGTTYTNSRTGPTVDKSHYNFNYIIINKLGDFFKDSITDIMSCTAIGVAFICSSDEKLKDLSWVVIHAEYLYLYDVISLGKSAFSEGLKDIFENAGIVKLIFDCRLPSHMLLHRYDSLLTNVLDVKVLSTVVDSFSHSLQKMPKHLNSLEDCVSACLNVPMGEVSIQACRTEKAKKDPSYWFLRPIDGEENDEYEDLLQGAIFEAVHLKDLKKALIEKMMEPAVEGTDIFLSLYRDAKNTSILQTGKDLVPKEFNDRSVLRYTAEDCRRKTLDLLKRRGQELAGGLNGKVADAEDLVQPVSKDTSKEDCSEQNIAGSDKVDGRKLLSKIIEDARREPAKDIHIAPCGSENGYSLNQRTKTKNGQSYRNDSRLPKNPKRWTGGAESYDATSTSADFRQHRSSFKEHLEIYRSGKSSCNSMPGEED